MTSNNPQMKGDYPFMMMARQKPTTSDYDEKCDDLTKCILKAYPFFMWYGSISKSRVSELFSILFLESLFLQMLLDIKDIFLMRGKKLCNERTDTFKDLLVELNNEMRKGTKFIGLSNQCLKKELSNGNPIVSSMRQEVVEGFRDLSGWLSEEAQKPANKERAEALADELGLNYDMKLFGCIGDGFKHHTNMVLNGLILLSFPSMPDTQTDSYHVLFDNSVADLQANKQWKYAMEQWKRKISKAYDLRDIVEDKDKVVFLKKLWAAVDTKEQAFLDEFGIVSDNTRSDSEKATMGYRIYRNLNMDIEEECHRMKTTDLLQYLMYVIQKRYLDDEIDRLKPKPLGKSSSKQKGGKTTKRRLFKMNVDLALLKECLNEVYCRFYLVDDEDKEALEGQHNDLMAVMAYLYIICEAEGYFENADKGPFFKFCTDEVGFQTEMSDRTFRNRLDQLSDVYKKYCLKGSQKLTKETENDFRKVLRIFHGKPAYERLRRNMQG